MSRLDEYHSSMMDESLGRGLPWGGGGPLPETTICILDVLPYEMIVEVMKMMAPRDLARFVILNKKLYEIFRSEQAKILASVLVRQPEFNIMIYIYTYNELDRLSGGMLHPRIVDFERPSTSRTTNLLNVDEPTTTTYAMRMINVPINGRPSGVYQLVPETEVGPEETILNLWDLIELWKQMSVIDWWVDLYPTLRWRDQPEDRRCLRPHEEARLRRALARWWLFAWHCHSNGGARRNVYHPRKWTNDKRLHHIRVMSTYEILELEDLWATVFETVSRDLCSSPEMKPEDGSVELVAWGAEDGRHNVIVNTYLKFDPEQLKYFFEYFYRRKRQDIANCARFSASEFNLDTESLSSAITTVLEERLMTAPSHITRVPRRTIVDLDDDDDDDDNNDEEGDGDDDDDDDDARWDDDACPDGKPPLSDADIRAFPLLPERRLPYGDDGSGEPR